MDIMQPQILAEQRAHDDRCTEVERQNAVKELILDGPPMPDNSDEYFDLLELIETFGIQEVRDDLEKTLNSQTFRFEH